MKTHILMKSTTPLWAINILGLFICFLNLNTNLQVAQITGKTEIALNRPLYRDGQVVGETGKGEMHSSGSGEQIQAETNAEEELLETESGSSTATGSTEVEVESGSTTVEQTEITAEESDTSSGSIVATESGASVEIEEIKKEEVVEEVELEAPPPPAPAPAPVVDEPKGGGILRMLTFGIIGLVVLGGIGGAIVLVRRKKKGGNKEEVATISSSKKKKEAKATKLEDVLAEMEEETIEQKPAPVIKKAKEVPSTSLEKALNEETPPVAEPEKPDTPAES